MKYGKVQNYYNGEFVDSKAGDWLDVTSPLDGNLLSQVPMSTTEELDDAVKSAKDAARRLGQNADQRTRSGIFQISSTFGKKS